MRFPLVRWLQNSRWSIRAKLMAGFISVSVFLIILTALSYTAIEDLGRKINQVAATQEELVQVISLGEEVRKVSNAIQNMQTDMRLVTSRINDAQAGFITAEEAFSRYQPYLVSYDRNRLQLDEARPKIEQIARSYASRPGNQEILRFLLIMNNEYQKSLNASDNLRKLAGERQFASVLNEAQQLGPRTDDAINQIRLYTNVLENQANQQRRISAAAVADANNYRSLSQIGLTVVGIIAVFIAIVFGLLLTGIFTRPVRQLRARLTKLAEGDLATPLEVGNRDEFGELADTFNQSLTRLGEVVERVQHQAVRVSSAAAQIAAASSHAAVVSIEQAGEVAEVTVTIEELSHTAQQIAEAATLVAGAAEQALGSASDGQETVRESIVGINNLKNQVGNITSRILSLQERSQRVGHIIEQITSIADQTHLLALNAAIESAAAGEQGKRFAVVAGSVKQLAERSRMSTKDVQGVLGEIQTATNASVMATEQGMKEAERGVSLAHRSGDANESIIQMVERTVQLANAISLATQQQRSASEQVVGSMRQLATVIQDGAASAKQSSELASALDEIAVELRHLSSQFKVRTPPPGGSDTPAVEDALPDAENLPRLPDSVPTLQTAS
jgi:methyl-accepting chemotaxis protein